MECVNSYILERQSSFGQSEISQAGLIFEGRDLLVVRLSSSASTLILKAIINENITGKIVKKKLKVLTMSEQIATMLALSHFYFFTRWYGILEEIFQIFVFAQPNIHQKYIGLLNVNDFYNNLLSFLNHAMEQRFITSST